MRRQLATLSAPDQHPDDYWVNAWRTKWRTFCEMPTSPTGVRDNLIAWQRRHAPACSADWIMDAALQTVTEVALHEQEEPSEWLYMPTEDEWAPFAPHFSDPRWHPDTEAWKEFRERTWAEFRMKLNDYRRDRMKASGEKEDERPATWLARYQCGEEWDDIADGESEYRDPSRSVENGARSFARRIGLDVRKKPLGRPPGSRGVHS
jgi:hypothetical protein